MNADVLSLLMERFVTFLDKEKPTERPSLTRYLDEFPSQYRLRDNIAPASLFFHRQWIRASIRGHRAKVKKAVRALERGCYDEARQELELAYLWLGQAQKLFETINFFTHFAIHDLDKYTRTANDLRTGDVILSYKTKGYIKKSRVSQLVQLATNSPITHILLIYRKDDVPTCIFSGDVTNGLGISAPIPARGELFIIMRPKTSLDMSALEKHIIYWYEEAEKRSHLSPTEQKKMHPFPETKCQVGSIVGITTVIGLYGGVQLSLKNPARNMRGFFCSEFIDKIFKDAGYPLTPRSVNAATVSPMEFLYSPLLDLQGVMGHPEDLLCVQDEIHSQFIG